MRDLHALMLAALVGGEGLRGIAELATEEAGGGDRAELTGLDPALGEDRERLGLGLKVDRIVAPTLPK